MTTKELLESLHQIVANIKKLQQRHENCTQSVDCQCNSCFDDCLRKEEEDCVRSVDCQCDSCLKDQENQVAVIESIVESANQDDQSSEDVFLTKKDNELNKLLTVEVSHLKTSLSVNLEFISCERHTMGQSGNGFECDIAHAMSGEDCELKGSLKLFDEFHELDILHISCLFDDFSYVYEEKTDNAIIVYDPGGIVFDSVNQLKELLDGAKIYGSLAIFLHGWDIIIDVVSDFGDENGIFEVILVAKGVALICSSSVLRSYLHWKHMLMVKQTLGQHHLQQLAYTSNCRMPAISRLNNLLLITFLRNWAMNYGLMYYAQGMIPLCLILWMQGFEKMHNMREMRQYHIISGLALYRTISFDDLEMVTHLKTWEMNCRLLPTGQCMELLSTIIAQGVLIQAYCLSDKARNDHVRQTSPKMITLIFKLGSLHPMRQKYFLTDTLSRMQLNTVRLQLSGIVEVAKHKFEITMDFKGEVIHVLWRMRSVAGYYYAIEPSCIVLLSSNEKFPLNYVRKNYVFDPGGDNFDVSVLESGYVDFEGVYTQSNFEWLRIILEALHEMKIILILLHDSVAIKGLCLAKKVRTTPTCLVEILDSCLKSAWHTYEAHIQIMLNSREKVTTKPWFRCLMFQTQVVILRNREGKRPYEKMHLKGFFEMLALEFDDLVIVTLLVPWVMIVAYRGKFKFQLLNLSFHDCSRGGMVKIDRLEANGYSYLLANDINIFKCSLDHFSVAISSYDVHVKLHSLLACSTVSNKGIWPVVFDPGGYDARVCLNIDAYQVENEMKLLYIWQLLLKALPGAIFSWHYDAEIYMEMDSLNGVAEMVLDQRCSGHLHAVSSNLIFKRDSYGYWGWVASNLSYCGVTTVDYMNCILVWNATSSVTWEIEDNTFPGLVFGVENQQRSSKEPSSNVTQMTLRTRSISSGMDCHDSD